jgi:hypothetical protein
MRTDDTHALCCSQVPGFPRISLLGSSVNRGNQPSRSAGGWEGEYVNLCGVVTAVREAKVCAIP